MQWKKRAIVGFKTSSDSCSAGHDSMSWMNSWGFVMTQHGVNPRNMAFFNMLHQVLGLDSVLYFWKLKLVYAFIEHIMKKFWPWLYKNSRSTKAQCSWENGFDWYGAKALSVLRPRKSWKLYGFSGKMFPGTEWCVYWSKGGTLVLVITNIFR